MLIYRARKYGSERVGRIRYSGRNRTHEGGGNRRIEYITQEQEKNRKDTKKLKINKKGNGRMEEQEQQAENGRIYKKKKN